jgi:hypothetical protein
MVAGFWFGSIGDIPGNKFVNFILLKFPGTYLFWFSINFNNWGFTIISLLAYFGGQIVGYGRILKN